jgi:hypothetical protein
MKNKNHLNEESTEQRVVFKDKNIREKFFLELKQEFGSWKSLGIHFKVYKSRLENLRNGSISIPNNTFIEFCKILNEKSIQMYSHNIILKDKDWGRSKGGKSTYEKHKDIFEIGRSIASKNNTYKIDRNIEVNPELCEFIGAFIGDGFMNKYGSKHIIQITGDLKLDKEYYRETLIPIITKISPKSNPSLKYKDNTLRLNLYSKGIYELFTQRFKMKSGKKVYTVTIPEEIINSGNYNLINSCLRGIYDTDGCVAFDKRKSYTKSYIRIVLHMKSPELIRQIYNLLIKQDINATRTKDIEHIQINGITECKKFVQKVGFSNPRHLNKIKNLI